MHGCFNQRLAWSLAILVTCGLSTAARGQQFDPSALPVPSGYPVAGESSASGPQFGSQEPPGAPAQQVSVASEAVADKASLETRLADLEKQLKGIKDKETAAKAKAAGAPSVVVSGMIQTDFALFHQDTVSQSQFGDVKDGSEFRRARLKASGTAFDVVDYSIEADFAPLLSGTGWNSSKAGAPGYTTFTAYNQQTALKDTYIGIKELPLIGNVRIGHFKECFGLDQLTSDRFSTFMERSLADENALVPGRNTGIMAFNWTQDERATWAVGAFHGYMTDASPIYQDESGGTALTMRGTWLPWYDEATEGRGLLHTGIAYSYRDVDEQGVKFAARPEAHLGPNVVSLAFANNQYLADYQLVGAEVAYVYGPFSVQSEYFGAFLNNRGTVDNGYLNGGYVYFSYFLTGESRPYNRKNGTFDRVRPFENFFRVRGDDGCVQTGKGAWEFAYRFSYLDLNDANAGYAGGYVADHTLGLNWYLNSNTRLMWNWVHSMDTPQLYTQPVGTGITQGTAAANSGVRSGLDTFEMRAAIDF